MGENPRAAIYYWKCDRPAAFHGTEVRVPRPELETELRAALAEYFDGETLTLAPAGGQGNHITFRARIGDTEAFVRIEDGPERDDYLEVESYVLAKVRQLGLPAPKVLAVDATRQRAPFAWQVLEYIGQPDLNESLKQGTLDLALAAEGIGQAVARWQSVKPSGFGPFDAALLRREGRLAGFHSRYADYFQLHLERHLHFLAVRDFLPQSEAAAILVEITRHRDLLELSGGCLVHKDLALWNVLGTAQKIGAYIDWDDVIAGDAMDDLSLLGCFYDGPILSRALAGYTTVRLLPTEHRRRFWLHLLRNMIVKAVIRVGAGYFERNDGFFLIGAGSSGEDLRAFTRARLANALRGLREDQAIEML